MASEIKKVNQKSVEAYHEFGGIIKHAARYNLWLPEAITLKQEKHRFLKYCTLPGKWAWDIFFFEQNKIIKKKGRGFPDVRFCDNNAESYATAKRLLGSTVGIKGNFEDLVLNGKPVFWDGFPYDVYNLDFCGTCFPDNQPPFSNTFEAISLIIQQHIPKKHFPFLLFLTMKALDSETRAEAKTQLKSNIENNRRNPEIGPQIEELIPNIERFASEHFAEFISISVPKMICGIADNNCKVEVKHRAMYPRISRDGSEYFIVKFVFKFGEGGPQSSTIPTPEYVRNVLELINLNNIEKIDNSAISTAVKESHEKLQEHIKTLDQGRLQ
jgi:hypothetical protein